VGGGVLLGPLGPGWLWWWRNRWNDWQGKPKYSEKTCPSAALSTTNPTCCLDVNPGRCGGKPATNRLSYGMTYTGRLMGIFVVRNLILCPLFLGWSKQGKKIRHVSRRGEVGNIYKKCWLGKFMKKRPLGISKTWKDAKTYFKELGCRYMSWIKLAYHWWWILQIHINRKFLELWIPIAFIGSELKELSDVKCKKCV
jgi:hypothetical protein